MRRSVVSLIGGLGNALFQLSFGLWLERESSRPVTYDYTRSSGVPSLISVIFGDFTVTRDRFAGIRPTAYGRFEGLGRLIATASRRTGILVDLSSQGPEPAAINTNLATSYYGYWQRLTYAEVLRQGLDSINVSTPRDRSDVVMHVRGGDMLSTPSSTSARYYANALEVLASTRSAATADLRVLVVTDDEEWCRTNLQLPRVSSMVIRRGETAIDFLCMVGAPSLIIPRSTFSWWAGYLGAAERLVVAPTDWHGVGHADSHLVPRQWLRVGE